MLEMFLNKYKLLFYVFTYLNGYVVALCMYKLVHILSLLIMYTEAAVLHQLRCLKNVLFHPLVDGLFHRYNATVLAYGQTGSGKRHIQWELVIEMITRKVLSPKSWMQYSTRLKLRDMKLNSSYMFPSLRENMISDEHQSLWSISYFSFF